MLNYNVDDLSDQEIKELVELMSKNPELEAKFRAVLSQISKSQGWKRDELETMLEEQKGQNSRIDQALRLNADAIKALTLKTERIEKRLP